jgi:hypothetical protein
MKFKKYLKLIKKTSRRINYSGATFTIHEQSVNVEYNYIATNEDGSIVLFDDEPKATNSGYWSIKTCSICSGDTLFKYSDDMEISNWHKSLRKISDIVVK